MGALTQNTQHSRNKHAAPHSKKAAYDNANQNNKPTLERARRTQTTVSTDTKEQVLWRGRFLFILVGGVSARHRGLIA